MESPTLIVNRNFSVAGVLLFKAGQRITAEEAAEALLEAFRNIRAVAVAGDIVTAHNWVTLALRRAVLNANQRYTLGDARGRLLKGAITEGILREIPSPDAEAAAAADAEALATAERERKEQEAAEAARLARANADTEIVTPGGGDKPAPAEGTPDGTMPVTTEGSETKTETASPGQDGKGAPDNKTRKPAETKGHK